MFVSIVGVVPGTLIVIGLVLIFIVLFMPKVLLGIRELLGGGRWHTTA